IRLTFLRTSEVTVMMWQPISSAWKMFRSSRGLAQTSCELGSGAINSSADFIRGTGSRPVSATRPAKTEMYEGAPPRRAQAPDQFVHRLPAGVGDGNFYVHVRGPAGNLAGLALHFSFIIGEYFE